MSGRREVGMGGNDGNGPRVNRPGRPEDAWWLPTLLGATRVLREPKLSVEFGISRKNFPTIEQAALEVLAHYFDVEAVAPRSLSRTVTVLDGDRVLVEAAPDRRGTPLITWNKQYTPRADQPQ